MNAVLIGRKERQENGPGGGLVFTDDDREITTSVGDRV